NQRPGPVPDPDGDLPRLRRAVRDLRHPAAGALPVPGGGAGGQPLPAPQAAAAGSHRSGVAQQLTQVSRGRERGGLVLDPSSLSNGALQSGGVQHQAPRTSEWIQAKNGADAPLQYEGARRDGIWTGVKLSTGNMPSRRATALRAQGLAA